MTLSSGTRPVFDGNLFQAIWVVEPEHKHDLYDMHYGHYYDDDIGGGWGGLTPLLFSKL